MPCTAQSQYSPIIRDVFNLHSDIAIAHASWEKPKDVECISILICNFITRARSFLNIPLKYWYQLGKTYLARL